MDLRFHEPRGHLLGPGHNTYVAHCNHYNCFLQKALRSNPALGMDEVLVETAAMLFYVAFASRFHRADWSLAEKLDYVTRFFRARGYGNPDLGAVRRGEPVTATASHHSAGYLAKFGAQDEPQDVFLTGAIQGALMAAFQHDVTVQQTACLAMGDAANRWSITRHRGEQARLRSYYDDARRIHEQRQAIDGAPRPDRLPAQSVTSSVRNMSLIGDEEEGLIPAFNVYLTFIPSLYYNVCSQIFLRRMQERGLSRKLGVRLLKEAGHVCGFYTLGNIALSSEFALLRQASFGSNPTERESMAALFGVVNALGWGYWTLDTLTDDTLTFSSYYGYEPFNVREYFGVADEPVCQLLIGGGEALMNALRDGDILHYDGALDKDYVNRVFAQSDGFAATETRCLATGDDHCTIRVTRPTAEAPTPAPRRSTLFAA
jgi:hypothetical protein